MWLDTCSLRLVLQIGNHTIKLSMLNKDSKWTKALKLMLANLKVRHKLHRAGTVLKCPLQLSSLSWP
jgi:hypothetical protein